jgi:hypothetical protein
VSSAVASGKDEASVKANAGKVMARLSRQGQGPEDPVALANACTAAGATIIYVNLPEKALGPAYLNLGQLTPDPAFTAKVLKAKEWDDKLVKTVLSALGGVTSHQAHDMLGVTFARDGAVTPGGVLQTRRSLLHVGQGLEDVDLTPDVYMPPANLKEFVEQERDFFLGDHDPRLRPRGILFDGPPGTGKTQAAKFIATQWGVSLFRLGATVLNKYVGESEGNLDRALMTASAAAPCVLLIDEVEKFFAGGKGENTGVMRRMMGSLLWYMQENDSRVLVLMTTNDRDAIPPELYRPGRVDHVMEFNGANYEEAQEIAKALIASFTGAEFDPENEACARVMHEVEEAYFVGKKTQEGLLPHVEVAATVRTSVKNLILKQAL